MFVAYARYYIYSAPPQTSPRSSPLYLCVSTYIDNISHLARIHKGRSASLRVIVETSNVK